MTAGFQAFTDSGLFQIDGTTTNYLRTQVYSLATAAAAGLAVGKANSGVMNFATANILNFAFNAQSPLLVLYSPNAPAAIMSCVFNGGINWTVQLWSYAAAAAVELHIFEPASVVAPSGAGYGLQVFDGNGVLIADARQRFARVLDVQAGNIFGVGAGWGEFTTVSQQDQVYPYVLPGVTKVGVGAILTPFLAAPNLYYRTQGYQTVGNVVNRNWRYNRIAGTEPGTQNCFGSQLDWRFMAVDLSNM